MSEILLSCLAVTGAMKTTSTGAAEALLGLSPLHMMINKEPEAGIYTLICTQHWRPTSTKFGHTKKSQDVEQEPYLQMGSDMMFPR